MKINADYIRQFASENYIKTARERGMCEVSIPVKDVEVELKELGLENNRVPLICASLRGNKFQRENGIVLERADGPRSGLSTTVVFHFRLRDSPQAELTAKITETPEERAVRLAEKLRGLLKKEIAEHGGARNFLRLVRSDDEAA